MRTMQAKDKRDNTDIERPSLTYAAATSGVGGTPPMINAGKSGETEVERPTDANVVRDKNNAPSFVDAPSNVISMDKDGNCMFNAIATAVSDPDMDHSKLRSKVCDLESQDPFIRQVYPGLDGHLVRMRLPHTWGGETELLTAARVVHRRI